jgi:hypothetical protein
VVIAWCFRMVLTQWSRWRSLAFPWCMVEKCAWQVVHANCCVFEVEGPSGKHGSVWNCSAIYSQRSLSRGSAAIFLWQQILLVVKKALHVKTLQRDV